MANNLPQHHTQTLSNGMQVVVIPLKNGSGVISTNVFYKVGSRDENLGISGIAHMLEHMNFKSTKNLKAGEFDEIVKSYGGVDNASTSFDYTNYYIKSSSGNLARSLGLFAELMQNLNLTDEEFQPERKVVAEERRWRTDNNPVGLMYFKLFNLAYEYHPYHWTPIGFMHDIQSWTIEDLKTFHATYYQPKNAILVVSGDIDEELVFQEAKKVFEAIPNTKEIPRFSKVEPEQDGARRAIVHKESEVEMVAIGFKVPDYTHKDNIAIGALGEILAGGKSSRLTKKLVDEKKLATSVHGYSMDLQDPGLFIILAMANAGVKAEELEAEILSELKAIKSKQVEAKELEKIIINTRADFIFSMEDSSTISSMFGGYLIRGSLEPLLKYEENLSSLTPKELKEVANRYLNEGTSSTIILKKGAN